jgi:hypothetical protein
MTALLLLSCLALPAEPAAAQGHTARVAPSRGAAVSRAVPRVAPAPRVPAGRAYRPYGYHPYVYPYRPYAYGFYPYYPYYAYYPYYSPGFHAGVSFGVGVGYAYPYPSYYAPDWGSLRIRGPHDAEVWADGYYMGIIDDFDGVLQQLNLTAGPHDVEIRTPNAAPVTFDVNIMPGQTVTYRTAQPH